MIRDNLENMPFKPSEQKSTLAGNARMFGRLLCSVLRTIRQKHKWCEEYPFDEKQTAAADGLWTALDSDKSEEADAAVVAAIHKLVLVLFCKEREDISKGDFACPVYRFLSIIFSAYPIGITIFNMGATSVQIATPGHITPEFPFI